MQTPQHNSPLYFNSTGHQVLMRLAESGGKAEKTALLSLFPGGPVSKMHYLERALDGLEIRRMVRDEGSSVAILALGEGYLKKVAHRIKPAIKEPVLPRYVPPMREMKPCQIGVSHRAGADDYRKWPSLMGDRRVLRG
jgi:hypothetical protein